MADAAPATVVRRLSMEPLALHAGLEPGAGGEARAYALAGHAPLVAGVCHAPTRGGEPVAATVRPRVRFDRGGVRAFDPVEAP